MVIERPSFHRKGWGYELWLVNNEKYCGKILHFNVGKRCSFHYHLKKHEHFYIAQGCFDLFTSWGDELEKAVKTTLHVGDVVEIPTGLRHQMVSVLTNGEFFYGDGEIIEISTQHFEDDSFRIIRGD